MRRRAGRGAVMLEHGRDFLLRHARHVLLLCVSAWLLQAGGRAAAAVPTSSGSTSRPTPTSPPTPGAAGAAGLTPGAHGSSPEQTTLINNLDAVRGLDEPTRENGGRNSRKSINIDVERDDETELFFNMNDGNVTHTGVLGSDVDENQKEEHAVSKKAKRSFINDQRIPKQKPKIDLGKIKNGKVIDIAARPWSVHIWVTQYKLTTIAKNGSTVTKQYLDEPPNMLCTGSLIGKYHVLFAAHCVDLKVKNPVTKTFISPSKIKIFVGRNSVDKTSKGGIELTLQENVNLFYHDTYTKYIEAVFKENHKCFLSGVYVPDIAILKLDRSALDEPGGDNAAVIPLPKGKELDSDYFYHRECFATGAGLTENLEFGTLYDARMELSDPLKDKTRWIKLLKEKAKFNFDDRKGKVDTDSHLNQSFPECVKMQYWYAPGKDDSKIFFGDSGGPLACWGEDGRQVLAGVAHAVIFERKDADETVDRMTAPMVATVHYRTAPYVAWMNAVLGVADGSQSTPPKAKGDDGFRKGHLRQDMAASHGSTRHPAQPRAARALAAGLTLTPFFWCL